MKMTGISLSALKQGRLELVEFDYINGYRLIELSPKTKVYNGITFPARSVVYSTEIGEVVSIANLDMNLHALSPHGARMVNPSQIVNTNKIVKIIKIKGSKNYSAFMDDGTLVFITGDRVKGLEHLITDN